MHRKTAYIIVCLHIPLRFPSLFKYNERSEDSYIGLADFFVFIQEVFKVSNNYRCAFIHIDAFMNALRYFLHFLSSIEIYLLKVT